VKIACSSCIRGASRSDALPRLAVEALHRLLERRVRLRLHPFEQRFEVALIELDVARPDCRLRFGAPLLVETARPAIDGRPARGEVPSGIVERSSTLKSLDHDPP